MKKNIYFLNLFLLAISILPSITMAQGNDYQYIMHDGDNIKLEYVPGEIIVKYKENDIKLTNSRDKNIITQKAAAYNLQVNKTIDKLNMVVLKTNENQNINEIMNFLQQDDDIDFVEPNYLRYLDSIPTNDSYRNNLRALHNYGQNVNGTVGNNDQDIDRLEAMHIFSGFNNELTTGTIVAIIDNGVAYTHPDVSNKMRIGSSCKNHNGVLIGGCIGGYDYYNNTKNPAPTLNSHGTHIAGTIAAEMNNNKGIIGVNPNAKIMALKAGEDQSLSVSNVISAINFAIQNGVKIINASYGSNSYSVSEYNAILAFKNAGGLFITAAGNDANNNDTSSRYPCNYNLDNIICVGATTQNGALASFSNYGATSVHVGAPGTNIYSSILGNKTTFFSENFESITLPNIPISFSSYGPNRTTKNNSTFYVEDGNLVSFGKSLFTNTGETYQDGMDSYIYSNSIDLSLAEIALFQFAIKCNTDSGTGDVLKLEFSSDGINFVTKTSITGGTTPSTYSTIGTSINSSYFTSYFTFRFHWKTDDNGQVGSGCWIDNINVITYYTGTHDTYGYMQGTSMATPHVVGLASLAWSFRPDLSYLGIKNAIINNGDYLTSLSGITISSNKINAYNTLYDIDNFPPTNPVLISPLSGANITGGNIDFLWSGATDIGVGVSGYYYQLSTGNNFISPITGIVVFTTGIIIPLSNTGTYYRRVCAFDEKNNTGVYSDAGIFTINLPVVWDTTPDPVLFTSITNAELNTLYISNITTIVGINTGIIVSLDTGQYRINGGDWITITGTVYSGDTIQLRLTGANAFNTSRSVNLIYGDKSINFTITTRNINSMPSAFTFVDITNAELNTVYTSNVIAVFGLETGYVFAVSITTGQLIKNNNLIFGLTTDAQNGDTLSMLLTSNSSYSTQINSILRVGSGSATYSVVTKSSTSGGGGGGGGGGGLSICLNDQLICLNGNRITKSGILCQGGNLGKLCEIITGGNTIEMIMTGNIIGSKYAMELNDAYIWAYANNITTMNTIDKADVEGSLIRSHTAKMMSNFALMLGIVPNAGLVCDFSDISQQSDEMKYYIKLSCQLGLMGQRISNFDPNGFVTRAQFGTILSRVIWGEKYNIGTPYYKNHLNALKESEIMTKINTPNVKELRGRVMLMVMRVDEKIKQNKINF